MEYPNTVCASLFAGGTIAVGTTYAVVCKVPSDATGGCLTVTSAGVSSRAAIGAGSSPDFKLVTLSTASVLDGTIATFASGAFTAGTAKTGTMVTALVDADKYIAWLVAGTAVADAQCHITGFFNFVPGY